MEEKKVKKKTNNKEKGNKFEREISRKLSLWISEGARDDIFWRTAGSGAMATNRFKKKVDTEHNEGDLKCDHPDYAWFLNKIYTELKRGYAHWGGLGELLKFQLNKDGLWSEWNDIKKVGRGKKGMLIWKGDRQPISIISDLAIFQSCRNVIQVKNCIVKSDPIWIISWDDFTSINPENMRESLEQTRVFRRTR